MLPVKQLNPLQVETYIDKHIAREAAQWSVKLHPSAKPSAKTIAECESWRAKDAIHEIAWQRAQELNTKFGILPPGVAKPTLDRPSLPHRRHSFKALVAAITAVPIGWYAYRNGAVDSLVADYRTAVGERRSIQLTDGSQVELNTDSAIDIAFNEGQRLLIVRRGEVLIQTANDPRGASRPFLVKTAQGILRPLGTRFSVRTLNDTSTLSVFEHAVELTIPASPAVVVNQGQQVTFSPHEIHPPSTLPAHADAWKDGLLFAFKKPLATFASELGRYRKGWIQCHPSVADMPVSGTFQLGDTDHVLQALVATLPVQVKFITRYWVSIEPLEG